MIFAIAIFVVSLILFPPDFSGDPIWYDDYRP
jgi:hypothetical protein